MKTSQYFAELQNTYAAEVEDHSTDSEGRDVLRAQLTKKRAQFAELLPMMEMAPEMVALCFHGGISFPYPKILDALLLQEPDDFPEWSELAQSLKLLPWAQRMADRAVEEEGGPQFLVIAAALEYLHGKQSFVAPPKAAGDEEDEVEPRERDEYGDEDDREPVERDEEDAEEAGAAWLAEQGFDKLD